MSLCLSVRRSTLIKPVGVLQQLLVSARSRRMAAAALVWFGHTTAAHAQESIRMSLASAGAAEARGKAATTVGYYNLKLGPTAWNFSSALGVEYNDNLRGSPDNPQQDVIFRPEAGARMLWPISEVNSLNFSLGAGYALYTQHSGYSHPFITPGSELSFDLYVGDFWINLHNRFSIQDNAYLDPTITGVADYQRLENVAGVGVTWDLNKIIARFGYDHASYVALGTTTGQPNAESEVFSTSAGYALKPGMLLGLETGGSLTHYTATGNTGLLFTDSTQWNVGPFFETQLSEYMRFRVSSGYTVFSPESTVAGAQVGDFSGLYAIADFRHRVNEYVDYGLSGGRNVAPTLYSTPVEMYFVTLQANWHVIRKTQLGTSFSYQNGSQATAGGENYDWYGPGLSVSRLLAQKLTGSLAYQYYVRTSDVPNRDYNVNVVSLNLRYQF